MIMLSYLEGKTVILCVSQTWISSRQQKMPPESLEVCQAKKTRFQDCSVWHFKFLLTSLHINPFSSIYMLYIHYIYEYRYDVLLFVCFFNDVKVFGNKVLCKGVNRNNKNLRWLLPKKPQPSEATKSSRRNRFQNTRSDKQTLCVCHAYRLTALATAHKSRVM